MLINLLKCHNLGNVVLVSLTLFSSEDTLSQPSAYFPFDGSIQHIGTNDFAIFGTTVFYGLEYTNGVSGQALINKNGIFSTSEKLMVLNPTNGFTISFWFNALLDSQELGYPTNYNYLLWIELATRDRKRVQTGVPYMRFQQTNDSWSTPIGNWELYGTQRQRVFPIRSLDPFRWNHFAITHSGSKVQVFTNGVNLSALWDSYLLTTNISDVMLTFRTSYGAIDELKFYEYAVAPEDIYAEAMAVLHPPITLTASGDRRGLSIRASPCWVGKVYHLVQPEGWATAEDGTVYDLIDTPFTLVYESKTASSNSVSWTIPVMDSIRRRYFRVRY